MKAKSWATLVRRYRHALAIYAARGDEEHLQRAYDLGRSTLHAGLGVLDMVRLRQEALPEISPAEKTAPARLAKAVETFLMEALSPFEAAHRGFHDACMRLRGLNETLEQRNRQLAATNVRLGQEIVGRKNAQEAAQESELKFRSVVESASDAIITVDHAGRLVSVNPGAEKMFGYARAELIGKSFTRLLPARRRAATRFQLRRIADGNGTRLLKRTLESSGLHRDGTEFPLELSLATWRTREGVFCTGIVRDIAERKQAERALRESRAHYIALFQEARAMEENLRLLSNRVLTAQEEERKHISRELHDEIGQALTAANVSIALLREHARTDEAFGKKVENAQRLLEQSMDMVHRFARELRPSMLDHLGPFAALQNYVKAFADRTGIRAELRNEAQLDRLDNQQGTVLYRVAQESLTNVFKHAQATRVTIRFRQLPRAVGMEISDNGRAAPPPAQLNGDSRQRLGLLGMRERVRLVHGEFAIESAPGRGTTVRVQIPFQPQPPPPPGGRPRDFRQARLELNHDRTNHNSYEQNQRAACR